MHGVALGDDCVRFGRGIARYVNLLEVEVQIADPLGRTEKRVEGPCSLAFIFERLGVAKLEARDDAPRNG